MKKVIIAVVAAILFLGAGWLAARMYYFQRPKPRITSMKDLNVKSDIRWAKDHNTEPKEWIMKADQAFYIKRTGVVSYLGVKIPGREITESQATEALALLKDYLATTEGQKLGLSPVEDYFRQYIGYEQNGHLMTDINLFAFEVTAFTETKNFSNDPSQLIINTRANRSILAYLTADSVLVNDFVMRDSIGTEKDYAIATIDMTARKVLKVETELP